MRSFHVNTLSDENQRQIMTVGKCFDIKFDDIVNGIVYYKAYAYVQDACDNAMMISKIYELSIRYSELRTSNICLDAFPPKTFFRHTDRGFIEHRLKEFNKWIECVYERNEHNTLLDFIRRRVTHMFVYGYGNEPQKVLI